MASTSTLTSDTKADTHEHDDGSAYDPILPGGSLLIAYQLTSKRILLVGGGAVAAGRLLAVLNASASHITLVSPLSGLCPEVRYRIFTQKVVHEYHDRVFHPSDLGGVAPDGTVVQTPDIVMTAIDEVGLGSEICKMCRDKRIIVNVADVPPECDFYFGSTVRRGPIQVVVSTGGRGPRMAHWVRERIERVVDEDLGRAVDNVGLLREGLRKRAPGTGGRRGYNRMEFVKRICDVYSVDELGQLDSPARERILEGWPSDSGPGMEGTGESWKVRSVGGAMNWWIGRRTWAYVRRWLLGVGFGRQNAVPGGWEGWLKSWPVRYWWNWRVGGA